MCVVRCNVCMCVCVVCQCVPLYSYGGQKTTMGTFFTFYLKMGFLLLAITYSRLTGP